MTRAATASTGKDGASPTGAGSDQRSMAGYRADIDGLRALAVLPIVAFHLKYSWIGGGYVGVDIFFVISGYLIGGGILRQIREGRYSIADFYFRRFRRIAPALVVTLIGTTVAAWFLLLPNAFKDYAKSLVATSLFGSNIWFWHTIDYFNADAETHPLLHTWSLAVEEQFYILFPLLMLFLRRSAMRTVHGVIIVLTLASLAASILLLKSQPAATFYLLHTRVWELLLGVIAVEIHSTLLGRSRVLQELLAWVGLALLGGSLFLLTPQTPFPGLAALPACLGTAMLLVAGAHGKPIPSRLLALQPLTFFGLISYSLYLWHWPVIVLMLQGLPLAELDQGEKLGAFALSVALAWGQWRFIERRWRAPSIPPRTIFLASGASAVLLCAVGGAIYLSRGVPSRFDPSVVKVAALLREGKSNDFRSGQCMVGPGYVFAQFDQRVCLRQDPARPNMLLLGDSHGAHLWSGLADRQPRLNVLQATVSSCKPMVRRDPAEAPVCADLMRFMFDRYLPGRPVPWVLLAGNWNAGDAAQVGETIDWLRARGFKVVLAGPVVRYRMDLPLLVAKGMVAGDPALAARFRRPDSGALDARYARLAARHGALYFSPYQALCGQGGDCRTLDDKGLPVQFDYGHLTRSGSGLVADSFPVAALLASGQTENRR